MKMSFSGPAEADGDNANSAMRQRAADQGGIRNAAGVAPAQGKAQTYRKDLSDPYANVGRNDPCPCGSGKKFKNCHGRPGRR